ncbi:MAG: polyprenyl synthetase family protein [Bacteroidales bacterium]|nr:polyprenyl synthetase family protein [Bacteroidales bacterium]
MEKNLKNITSCIEKDLEDFEQRFSKCLSDKEDSTLHQILRYAFDMKGKRIRPVLAMLVAGGLGQITEQTKRASLIVELLHMASLLHDDVLDNSNKRRGKQTINSLWGNHVAILVGDYMYGRALSLINTREDFNLMPIYAKIAMDLPKGEIDEMESTEKTDTSVETYLKVIYNKTASLIEASVLAGLVSSGADAKYEEQIRELGKSIGIAYQIKDDMLDYKNNTGKQQGIDIQEKKITLPLIYFLEQSSETEKEKILEFVYSDQKTQEETDSFVARISQSEAMKKVEADLEYHSRKALQIAESLPQNAYTMALTQLVQYLIFREF